MFPVSIFYNKIFLNNITWTVSPITQKNRKVSNDESRNF